MNEESYEIYLSLCEMSLVNAEQFLRDAILLRENKSYGHANSLAILGFEELTKSWWAFFSYIGMPEYIEGERRLIFKDHLTKHKVGLETLEAFHLLHFKMLLKDTIYEIKLKEIEENAELEFLDREKQKLLLIKEISKDKENKKIASKAMDLLKLKKYHRQIDDRKLNERKNEGLYVYDISDSGEIKTPQLFKYEDTGFIDTLNGLVHFFKRLKDDILANLDNPDFIRVIQVFRFLSQELTSRLRSDHE